MKTITEAHGSWCGFPWCHRSCGDPMCRLLDQDGDPLELPFIYRATEVSVTDSGAWYVAWINGYIKADTIDGLIGMIDLARDKEDDHASAL